RILGGLFDLESKQDRFKELENQMSSPEFWDDQDNAQKVIDETNGLKSYVDNFADLEERLENLEVSYELVKAENEQELFVELRQKTTTLSNDMNDFELQMLLSEPYDANNAILELHPGAGGTESQDWASILLRMYQRWAEGQNYKVET